MVNINIARCANIPLYHRPSILQMNAKESIQQMNRDQCMNYRVEL